MFGTVSLDDLLSATQPSIIQFGEDRVFQGVSDLLEIHNRMLQEKLVDFVVGTTDRLRRYGGPDQMVMEPLDEGGVPNAQKVSAGSTVGFPLRRYGNAVQFTRDWMNQHSPQEFTVQIQAQRDADLRTIDLAVRRAIFNPTNYTFTDRLVQPTSQVTIPVKALVNADSAPLGVGPNGETFNAATHTHYLARAGGAVTNAEVIALVETVIEHHPIGQALIYISRTNEATMRALAGFVPYQDVRIRPSFDTTVAIGTPLDPNQINNRAIGVFNATAEVWVKPWMPANYFYAWVKGGPTPLAMREPDRGDKGLRLIFENDEYPLRASAVARDFGIAVWNRTNGAALYIGGTSYVAPTLS